MGDYTIAQIDAAIEAIIGRPIFNTAGSSRPHQMLDAASQAWIAQRPEDEHSAVLRSGLLDMNSTGTLRPSDGVWP